MGSHHMSLSLSRELWHELLRAALPVQLAGGQVDLAANTRSMLKQLQVKERVVGLLEDQSTPKSLQAVRDRALTMWRDRRSSLYRRINDVVRIEGSWRVELDEVGTELRYGRQQVAADAYVRGVAEGTVSLLRENIEFPFVIERRIGASIALKDIHYDPGHRAVIGSLQDLGVYLGDSAVLQLVARLAEYGLDQQLPQVNPIPILRRDQVQEMVGPMGGSLNMQLGVEDLDLHIDHEDLQLRVKFGFSQAQLPQKDSSGTD